MVPEPDSFVNSLRQVELVFSEGVAGLEADDLLVNGLSATNVTEVSDGDYVFDLPALDAGPVSVRLRADHGITDRSSSSNSLKTTPVWTFQLDPNARLEQLRITEFLSDNEKGLRDEDGSREDWLEVRNFGRDAMTLKGWGLGVDPRGTGRWISIAHSARPMVAIWNRGCGAAARRIWERISSIILGGGSCSGIRTSSRSISTGMRN